MTATERTEPNPDAGWDLTPAGRRAVLICVVLGMLMSALDQTIVSTALPRIVGDLGGGNHLSWVVTAYLLGETVSTPLWGKLGDLIGRKRVFQACVIIFLTGSVICGLSQGIGLLIAFRAVQGLGGGGLMVTASALIADAVPLKDRGRYQGALGSVFGVVTVIGPLLGGFLVDQASWRWCFYVNVPVAVVVLALSARAMPSRRGHGRPSIDYAGLALVATFATSATLATSWGGSTYPWLSVQVLGLAGLAAVSLAGFVAIELRRADALLPMRLFKNPVFAVCAPLSLIVGAAMFGGMSYLPLYQQIVKGVSATDSGLRMLAMVLGLLLASVTTGMAVSRTGRYKPFPIAGGAVMAVGLFLLSHLSANTGLAASSAYLFVFGVGIGLAMQVLTIAVQNTAPYRDLGAATAGVTLMRSLGSSVGVALFGTILTSQLRTHLPKGIDVAAAQNPAIRQHLSAAVLPSFLHGYAKSLDTVFLVALPLAVVAVILAVLLPGGRLTGATKAVPTTVGDGFAMPIPPDSRARLEQAVSALIRDRDRNQAISEILASSGTTLDDAQAWMLAQVYAAGYHHPDVTVETVASRVKVPASILAPTVDRLIHGGELEHRGGSLRFTATGTVEFNLIVAAWRDWLIEQLADPSSTESDELSSSIVAIAQTITRENPGIEPAR